MYKWPLNNTTREVNKGVLNLLTSDGSPQRFIKGQAFFKNNCLVKNIGAMQDFLDNEDLHISFDFENYPGMIEEQRYPIFSISPPSLSNDDYYGTNHENYGLKILYSYPQGLEVYMLGDVFSPGGAALSFSHNLDVFWNEGSNLGGNPNAPGIGTGGSEESPGVEVGGGGGGLVIGYEPHWDYYNNRKHKLDLILVKLASNTYRGYLYIDGILHINTIISSDTFFADCDLIVGGAYEYTFDGSENINEGLSYYNGCISNLKITRNIRKVGQKDNFFYYIPKIAFGGSSNEDKTLYLTGSYPEYQQDVYRDLYIYGTTLSFYTEPRTLYVNGVISSFDADRGEDKELYISGSETEILNTTLFIAGASFDSSYTLFIEGQQNIREYTKELFVYGSSGPSESIEDLYAEDHIYTYEIPLFIATSDTADGNWEYPLYIKGGNPGSDAYRPLFLQNDAEISEFYRTAIIIGDGSFGGSTGYNMEIPLVIGRLESWGLPLFIGNPATSTSLAKNMFISGIAGLTATTTLVMPKVSGPADTRTLYMRGRGT